MEDYKFKPLVFAIDFDGTCVTHSYPELGQEIGAPEVLKRIVEAGHRLILYTMRSGQELEQAKGWFEEHDLPLFGVNTNPTQHTWTASPKAYANMYIDDAALGAPLLFDPEISDRPYMNWKAVHDIMFQHKFFGDDYD